MSIRAYLHRGFGHPCKGYEHFLPQVKAGTQDADVGEQDPNQQGDEQRGDAQTYIHTHTDRLNINSETFSTA